MTRSAEDDFWDAPSASIAFRPASERTWINVPNSAPTKLSDVEVLARTHSRAKTILTNPQVQETTETVLVLSIEREGFLWVFKLDSAFLALAIAPIVLFAAWATFRALAGFFWGQR